MSRRGERAADAIAAPMPLAAPAPAAPLAVPLGERALAPLIALAAIASGALSWWATGALPLAAGLATGALLVALLLLAWRRRAPAETVEVAAAPDWTVLRELADAREEVLAVTDRAGRLVCASAAYGALFGPGATPPGLGLTAADTDAVKRAGRAAWRDGEGTASDIRRADMDMALTVRRTGVAEDHLLWRFDRPAARDWPREIAAALAGVPGLALAQGGVMAALVGPEGRLRAANSAFIARATGRPDAGIAGRALATLLRQDDRQGLGFAAEGQRATPLRIVAVPVPQDAGAGPAAAPAEPAGQLLLFLDEDGGAAERGIALSYVETLLSLLPVALALVDRDGRFLFVNRAFTRAAGSASGRAPRYPGDIVVREDKTPLAEMIRRHGVGQQAAGDMTVRLAAQPDEPVQVRVIGVRGLGEASVLLSLKDNQEATRLQGQVAQASKMQAIGQLAGGIAHDFNNILTAVLGACDLMLMRHTPGDGDYDDIQQIRSNASRAASLTRQLLAFSRQQTLRPQIVQLPDIVSDISHLLKRLMGERITLDVRHGRGLAPVRADPGQLEQVIVNLAVNARDAMLEAPAGSGTLTIETMSIDPDGVRALGHAIMPPARYSCIRVTDTGTGIAPDALAKIYEPFFTTKEAGKGTGLGLSTVYGIVKQSAGYVFADSVVGQGTSFTVYLPAHDGPADEAPPTASAAAGVAAAGPAAAAPAPEAQWGTGTILLVEDEDMVRAVAERALSRAGYRVVTAANGEDGLARLAELVAANDAGGEGGEGGEAGATEAGGVACIVTDVVMPQLDGPAMVRAIRAEGLAIPVIFMSGYAEEQLREDLSDLATAYLPKPFAVAELVATVGRTVARAGGSEGARAAPGGTR